jgi:hypothetical protein
MKEVKKEIETRLVNLLEMLDKPAPDWYNVHDFQSGYLTGVSNTVKEEVEWLANLINLISMEETDEPTGQ